MEIGRRVRGSLSVHVRALGAESRSADDSMAEATEANYYGFVGWEVLFEQGNCASGWMQRDAIALFVCLQFSS